MDIRIEISVYEFHHCYIVLVMHNIKQEHLIGISFSAIGIIQENRFELCRVFYYIIGFINNKNTF
jgi:hypothetical protein